MMRKIQQKIKVDQNQGLEDKEISLAVDYFYFRDKVEDLVYIKT